MMNNVTVSLEKAKDLRAAGWENSTKLSWAYAEEAKEWFLIFTHELKDDDKSAVPAPTAEEILRELPEIVMDRERGQSIMHFRKNHKRWWIYLETITNPIMHSSREEDTLANTAAAMWIYLKENNLLP